MPTLLTVTSFVIAVKLSPIPRLVTAIIALHRRSCPIAHAHVAVVTVVVVQCRP